MIEQRIIKTSKELETAVTGWINKDHGTVEEMQEERRQITEAGLAQIFKNRNIAPRAWAEQLLRLYR